MYRKMVKVKFVAHLMPEILVPNLSASKHFNPGFAPIEKWPGADAPIFVEVYSFFKCSDRSDFGAIRSGIGWKEVPPIVNFLIPGFPGPLQPAKLKNGHFWVVFDFFDN